VSDAANPKVAEISAETRFAVLDLYDAYAAALDESRFDNWASCFTENAIYRLTSKENYDRGLPISIIYCEGMGMIEDRAFTTAETTIAQPRSLRHFVSGISVRNVVAGVYEVRANFLVLQTLLDRMTEIVMAGRYIDRVVAGERGLLFQTKICISDTLLYPTSVVSPV
jgi:3-phenylpropionate/cinnamic acid dioxygenase small subunit